MQEYGNQTVKTRIARALAQKHISLVKEHDRFPAARNPLQESADSTHLYLLSRYPSRYTVSHIPRKVGHMHTLHSRAYTLTSVLARPGFPLARYR